MNLVFATNNKNKLKEIRNLLDKKFTLLSLADINCTDELPETCATIEGNASQKAWYVFEKVRSRGFGVRSKKNSQLRTSVSELHPRSSRGPDSQLICFADDTGLEIDALGGKPGVISARYAGELCYAEDNIRKVLQEMKGIKNRKAKFRCVLSLIINSKETQFEGRMEGTILTEKKGADGFGYDPIFQPKGLNKSFAEMILEEKNRISHRAVAVRKLEEFLSGLGK